MLVVVFPFCTALKQSAYYFTQYAFVQYVYGKHFNVGCVALAMCMSISSGISQFLIRKYNSGFYSVNLSFCTSPSPEEQFESSSVSWCCLNAEKKEQVNMKTLMFSIPTH